MATKHHISHASELYFGEATNPVALARNERAGIPLTGITRVSLGSPIAPDADGLIDAATSTELPNNSTITYTPATDGTSPLDNADSPAPVTVNFGNDGNVLVWPLDVPRNITVATTTAAAQTVVTITGYDEYGAKLVETITIALGGTAGAGKKAFKYVASIAIYSAGDITTDTIDIGFGDVLGLPYRLAAKANLLSTWFNDVQETTLPTVVLADATTPSATTGDVRGTVDLNSASNGSAIVLYAVFDPSSTASLFGKTQYGG